MPDRLYRSLALACLALLGQALPLSSAAAGGPHPGAQPAAGTIGIKLLEAPVARRHDPRARIYVVDHLAPGTSFRRRMLVRNGSDTPRRVRLYPAAAGVRSGRFLIYAGRARNELTGWISLDHTDVVMPAHSDLVFRATVAVPRSASRGERYAVIWAETASRPDGAHNVGVASRVGIRVYLDVGPGGEPPSNFRIVRLTVTRTRTGLPELVALVHNTGERALSMSGTLSLRDGPGGVSAGSFRVKPGVTPGPGETVLIAVRLERSLPAGPWTAKLTLRSGFVERTITARVTFPPSGTREVSIGGGLTSARAIGGSIATLGLILAGVLVLRRRRSSG